MKDTIIIKELMNSLSLIKKNSFLLVVAAIIDALFFIAYGFFTGPVSRKISEHAILLSNNLSPLLAEQHAQKGILELLFAPELRPLTFKLTLLILLLFAISYIIYCIFHGTSWWMAAKIAGQKWSYRDYVLGFAKINLIWLACYVVFKAFDTFFSIRQLIIEKIIPNSPNIASKVLLAVLILLSLSAFFSYSTLKAKTLFKTKIKTSIPLAVLCAAFFIIAWTLPMTIARLTEIKELGFILGLILIFPTIILIKVYSTRVLND